MLSHTEFVRKHWTDNGKGLRKRHQMFLCGVRVAGINCLNSNDGFFCWVDLRHLLQSRNQEGAIRLWKIILKEFGSNVSPGSSWHCSDPGWFSFCFSYMSDQTVQESLNQIQLFMERRRSNPIYDKERACQKMTAKKKERKQKTRTKNSISLKETDSALRLMLGWGRWRPFERVFAGRRRNQIGC